MSSKLNKVMYAICCAGIAINTAMFGFNLFAGLHQFAIFNLLSAAGCWVGIFSFGRKIDDSR